MATDLQAERVPNNVRRFSQVSLPDWHGHILAQMTRPLGGSTSIMVPSSAATFRSRGAEILSRSQLGFAYLCAEVIQLLHLARHLSGNTTVMQPGDKLALQPVSCPVTWRISCPAAGQFFFCCILRLGALLWQVLCSGLTEAGNCFRPFCRQVVPSQLAFLEGSVLSGAGPDFDTRRETPCTGRVALARRGLWIFCWYDEVTA